VLAVVGICGCFGRTEDLVDFLTSVVRSTGDGFGVYFRQPRPLELSEWRKRRWHGIATRILLGRAIRRWCFRLYDAVLLRFQGRSVPEHSKMRFDDRVRCFNAIHLVMTVFAWVS
jgi:hypothetical protein